MCCFSNHLFSSDSVTCRKDERLTYQSWKNRATHRIYVEHFKAKETYCLRSPLKQVFLSNLPNIQWNALTKQLPFFVCCFMCIFCSVFSLTKLSTILPLFFGRLSWILESHRLEMSKCKPVIDLWDVMRSTPRCCFFFSKCSILSLLCNHIAKEWFQDLFHHYM